MAYIGQAPANKPVSASDLEDGIITNAKLAQDIISAETELSSSPADTDEFLISDAGVLKRLDASLVGGGKVLQVIQNTYSTELSTTPSSFTDSGLSATITPSATSSKILILAHNSVWKSTADYVSTGIQRNISGGASTFLGDANDGLARSITSASRGSVHSINYLDSPSTTSAITYDFQYKCAATCQIQNDGSMAVMILIEIGA